MDIVIAIINANNNICTTLKLWLLLLLSDVVGIDVLLLVLLLLLSLLLVLLSVSEVPEVVLQNVLIWLLSTSCTIGITV